MKTIKKTNSYDGKLFSVILIIIAVIYDISPADIIPDIIPFTGFFDDIGITILIIMNLFYKWRKKNFINKTR